MADETRTANVNLTADVSGYTQGTQQAVQQTNKLTESVNKLTTSLDGITKRVGKKLLIFSAADLAVMTGFTLMAAKYEKQLATLSAQAVLGNKNIQDYKKGIDALARSLPVARGEIAALVTQIEHLGITSARQSVAMANTFTKMAAVTGEDVGQLTAGLIELSRTMGTLNNGNAGIERFAGSIATVSAEAGVSATAVISFAQSIAPLGRAAGIGQKELLGISTAFTKAGQDGLYASNAFSTIISDINRLTMSGSPEIAKYANAVGMTVEQFKRLGPTDQFIQIVDSVSKAGPKAVQILNDMGVDGTRAAKAFAALSSESGGLKKAVQDAVDTYGQNNMNSAAAVAMDTLDAKSTQLRNNLEQIGASIGSAVLPVAKMLMDVFNNILSVVNQFGDPILKLAGAVASIVGVMAGAGGSLLTAMGPLSALMMAMTVWRLSPMRTAVSGFREGITAGRSPQAYLRTGPTSEIGRRLARGENVPFYQRYPYLASSAIGAQVGRYIPEGGARMARLVGYGAFRGIESLATGQRQWIANAGMRQYLDRVSMFNAGGPGAVNPGMGGLFRAAAAHPLTFLRGLTSGRPDELAGQTTAQMTKNMQATSTAYVRHAMQVAAAGKTTSQLAAAAAGAARSLSLIPVAYAKMGGALALQGAGKLAAAPFQMLGGMFGMGPVAGAVMAAVGGVAYMAKNRNDSLQSTLDGSRNIAAINAKLGIATEPLNNFVTALKNGASSIKTVADAMNITAANARQSYGGEYTDPRVRGLPDEKTAVAYLRSLGTLNKDQAAIAMQDIANRFGYSAASRIGDQYLSQTGNGTSRTYGNQAVVDLMKGIQPTIDKNRGWFQHMQSALPTEVQDLISSAITAVQEEASPYQGVLMANGADLGQAIAGTRFNAMTNEVFNSVDMLQKEGESKDSWAGRINDTLNKRIAYIKGLEKAIGDEFDINVNDLAGISSKDQLTTYLSKYANQDAYKKYMEITGGGISETALNSLLNFNPASAQGTALAKTALGGFMTGNYYTNAVMTGSQDPEEVNKAIQALGKAAMDTTGNFADASTALVQAKVAIGDTSSRAYAIAVAAEQRIQSIATYRATTTQGWAGQASVSWQTSQAMMADPNTAQQGEASLRQQQLDVQQRIGQTLLAMEEYQIQQRQALFDQNRQIDIAEDANRRSRLRAFQDFARSMRRAAEDFAKSMYDPYQRIANTGVMSLQFQIDNAKMQIEANRQQNRDVERLREAGLSQQAIEGQKYNDPAYAYQTRFSTQQLLNNPDQIAVLNKLWSQKGAGAKDLMEEQTGYQNQTEDFFRSMRRNAFDFATQMKISADSFEIATNRAEKAAHRMGREATGDIKTLWTQTLALAKALGLEDSSIIQGLAKFFNVNPTALNDTSDTPGVPSATVGTTVTDPILGKVKYGRSGPVSGDGSFAADWYATNEAGKPMKLPDAWFNWSDKQKRDWMNGVDPATGEKYRPTALAGKQGAGRPHTQTGNWGNTSTKYETGTGGWTGGPAAIDPNQMPTGVTYPTVGPTGSTRFGVDKATQRGVATHGYSKPVVYRGGNTVITNSTHYVVQGDIRADDPEKLGRELKRRERNDNRRKGANARVSA